MPTASTYEKRQVRVGKLHPSKVYDYIKKIEIDGLPRVRAYAEAIDPHIYDLPPTALHRKLDRVREEYPNYDEIKEMVLAEEANWAQRKSHAAQDEALSLLLNTLKRANELVNKEGASAQDLNAANAVLKTMMPALTAVNEKAAAAPQIDKKSRASRYIN